MFNTRSLWRTRCLLGIALASVGVAGQLHAQFQGPSVSTPVPEHVVNNNTGNLPPRAIQEMPAYEAVYILAGDTLEIDILGLTTTLPSAGSSSNGSIGSATGSGSLHPVVTADGLVQVPYIGTVEVSGLTTVQAQHLIAAKLRDGGFILDPQVEVSVITAPSQVVAVEGEVKSPAAIPVAGERSLLGMLAAAGGLTPTASHLVTVIRQRTGETIQVQIDPNPANGKSTDIPIYPGDSILVPKAGTVYIVGAVKTQLMVPIATNTPLTLIQAITMAGGANFEAALSKTRIIRTEGTNRKEILLNVKKIFNGTEPDPILQADDIVYLPGNNFKGALKSGGTQTALGLVTAIALFAR